MSIAICKCDIYNVYSVHVVMSRCSSNFPKIRVKFNGRYLGKGV